MNLRYYQSEAKEAVEFGWEIYPRQSVKLPTGSGKTVFVAKLFEDLQPRRCLFLADQDELCMQPRNVIQRATGIIAGLEKAKDRANLASRIVVGSSQTLSRKSRLDRYPRDHFDYIVSDECHRGTDRDAKIWDHFETARVCGITATPYRANLADLTKWFPHMAYQMDILDLVEEGFAPPPLLLAIPVDIDVSKLKLTKGLDDKDFDLDSVDSAITPYYATIADIVKEHASGRHGIAYLPLIRSSEAFAIVLRSVGIRAQHIDGTSPDRDAILARFANGDIDWLCNSNLLSTGVDLPICDAFLNLRITQSRAWYQQARGRAMRVLPGVIDDLPEKSQAEERKARIAASSKPNCLIFDLLLQHDKLGVVHAAEDFMRNEHDAKSLFEKSKELKSPMEIEALAKFIQKEREAALVAALERAAIRSSLASPMTGKEIAAILRHKDILQYIPMQRWEQDAPTEAQLAALRSKGVVTSSIRSKGEAHAILDMIGSRSRLGYASVKQVKTILQFDEMKPEGERIKDPEKLTVDEASAIIDAEFKSRRRVA